MTESSKKILFIGAGRMAQAIIAGLNKTDMTIVASNNGDAKRLEEVEQKFGVMTTDSWKEEIEDADMIVLAMPPEAHESVLKEVELFVKDQFIVTLAAGIDPTYLEAKLPEGTPVAWVMPNPAASLGKSVSLYTLGKHVGEHHEKMLEALLDSIGSSEKVTEDQVHALTPITGSGSAFIYRMANSLVTSAIDTGVTEEKARKLVADMIHGAAAMLQTGEPPKKLIDQVASPGGVTAAGLEVMDEGQFDQMMQDVVTACHIRARNN
ncbi:pyrroline-5-carboxylate reductase [Paraliobacillus quinghaiensis]|uniref:Pyrroline-5-carboxylate reductase n=1 Tax=Paraliobacillus quinghaiensis TaxID=470815 RepID=A0A917WUJ7_9BACI|nr:pyrroline-5-carboxylate reductase [Paraliobacillus quinghaiensis]GGM33667.1 pyrroline-5-carboxylate reductase [Paraliobacillus quinghaiensis]